MWWCARSRTSTPWECTPATRSPSPRPRRCPMSSTRPCRDDAFACIRRVGVETGGSNIQFAVRPTDGRRLVIEMNPRVSRSSALASKATGFPIAKIAARLAVGYTLDEITNDITGATPVSFEPTIDYVVTKIPRWAFEKLPGAVDRLGTRMQSVGEVMAIGRTFPESLQKAIRSLEQGRAGLNGDRAEGAYDLLDDDELVAQACSPTPGRIFQLETALRRGVTPDALASATGVDPWFLDQLALISAARTRLESMGSAGLGPPTSTGGRGAPSSGWGSPTARSPISSPGRQAGGVGGSRAMPAPTVTEAEVRAARLGVGVQGHVQDRRHLRRRVRGDHAVPLRHLRGRGRGSTEHPSAGGDPRVGAQPDRPGDRVRLLLRPRVDGAPRGGLRDGDGELQPRDRLDRLRHVGPALLRAHHRRGRRQRARRRDRGGLGSRRGAHRGRDREPRRPDPAQARPQPPSRIGPRHEPGLDRPGRGQRALEPPVRAPRHPPTARGHRRLGPRGPDRGAEDRLPGSRPSQLRPRGPGHGDRLRRRTPDARGRRVGGVVGPGGRGHRRATRARRPVPRGRRRGRRRRRAGPDRRGRHRRGDGACRGGRGALRGLGLRAAPSDAVGRGDGDPASATPTPSPRRSRWSGLSTSSTP